MKGPPDPWNGEYDLPAPRLNQEQPDIVRLSERRWLLRKAFVYKDRKRRRTVVVPSKFVCDLASVPRVVWWLISPSDLGEIGPLLHDWIYRHAGKINGCEAYTREETDALFNEAMETDNVQPWKRKLAVAAVKRWGESAFRKAVNPMDSAA